MLERLRHLPYSCFIYHDWLYIYVSCSTYPIMMGPSTDEKGCEIVRRAVAMTFVSVCAVVPQRSRGGRAQVVDGGVACRATFLQNAIADAQLLDELSRSEPDIKICHYLYFFSFSPFHFAMSNRLNISLLADIPCTRRGLQSSPLPLLSPASQQYALQSTQSRRLGPGWGCCYLSASWRQLRSRQRVQSGSD